MGATSSAQRDSRCEEDAAEEEQTAAKDARDDGGADEKLLQKNGQISSLNIKTESHADELNGHFEERVLADVGSGFVTLKEDGTETTKDLQDVDAIQPHTENEDTEMFNADGVPVKEGTAEDSQVNDINEVGFKKIFRFVGFKFTLKKDTCKKTEGEEPLVNEQEETVANTSENSFDINEKATDVAYENSTWENTPDEPLKSEVSAQGEAADSLQTTEKEMAVDQDTKIVEHNVEVGSDKESAKVVEPSPEPEEPMSPFKQFFTQGIFASLRKRKKEEEIQKESKEEENYKIETKSEEALRDDSKCLCLDIPQMMSQEENDSQEKGDGKFLSEGELQNSLEKDKVQGSPLKRLFRKFSTRRQRESKAAEKVIEAGENISEQPQPSSELTEIQRVEEPVGEDSKPSEEEHVADVSLQESKKKSDSTVSWEALICGGSAKKRARKTNEDATPDKGEDSEKTTESPLGSSIEGDYDHLTSSNEQAGSPGEGEGGSTWKTFKKMVTPKRKIRTGESGSPEQIPSDSEISKDESFSMKKLIPRHKKRKSDGKQEQTSSDEAGKDAGTEDEDDETPAIIPLSEYEIIEPETLKEVNEKQVEIIIEHENPTQLNDSEPELATKVSCNAGPLVTHVPPEDFEELTDFMSKHQQLSDIPEEGIIEESIETPISSAEWTTLDDSLAEDIVELTADAVTAPEPASEEFTGDDTTEMVSAVSQLSVSPKTSERVSPVPAEYDVQKSDVILQEAVQSICLTPSVQSVTTKDENQETLAVSVSPYIVQSSIPQETKVLVVHKKTEATAICTGLVSQEIESAEEPLPAPLVEAIPEVSDAVPTELVSSDLTDEPAAAGFETDQVYEAEIKEVKTEYQEILTNEEKEPTTETELEREQVIQLLAEPLREEEEESHMVHEIEKEECLIEQLTGIDLKPVYMLVTDPMQNKDVLDQVISEHTYCPDTEGPLDSVLEEPVYEKTVQCTEETAEVGKVQELPDVELWASDFKQAANEEEESLTYDVEASVPDSTIGEAVDITEEGIESVATAVECLGTKEIISTAGQVSDDITAETLEIEVQIEKGESIHIKDNDIQVDKNDAVLETAGAQEETVLKTISADDSAAIMEDICEKMEENGKEILAPQEMKDIHAEESGDVVVSDAFQNIEVENILETADKSLDREPLQEENLNIPAKEVSLPKTVLAEEPEVVQKITQEHEECEEIVTLGNSKVQEIASDRVDSLIETKIETEKIQMTDIYEQQTHQERLKEELPLTKADNDESENQEVLDVAALTNTEASPKIIAQDRGSENAEIAHGISEDTVGFETVSKDELESKETTAEPEGNSKVILTHFESQVEDRPVHTEIVASQTEELSQDTEHSLEMAKKNEQPVTTENIVTTGKVLEMVSIIENASKESEKEKPIVVEPVVPELAISELSEAKEQEGDASEMSEINADRVDEAPAIEIKETAEERTEETDKTVVTKLKPENSEPTAIEMAVTTVSESVIVAQNDNATQMEVSVSEQKAKATEDISLKCESPEQLIEEPLAIEVQGDKSETKHEIPVVMDLNEETLAVTKPEVVLIAQVSPLSPEVKAVIPEVTVPEIQTQAVTELRAATLEMTEPKVETPVVTEVKQETATVTELEVETPVVTSVVTELEVETPVITSMAKGIDTNSTVTSMNQNTDSKEQAVEMPTVTPVVVTPNAALDVGTPESRPVGPVESTPAVTPVVEEPAVDPVVVTDVAPVVEMQNVTPLVEKPDFPGSVILTEGTPPVVDQSAMTTVMETVASVTEVKPTADTVEETAVVTPVVEKPDVPPVVETVGPVVVTPPVTPVLETATVVAVPEAAPPAIKPSVTSVADTSVVSPVVEMPVVPVTAVVKPIAAAMAPETLTMVSMVEKPVVTSVVETPAVASVAEMPNVTPVVEEPTIGPVVVTPPVTPAVETDAIVSVTETAPPLVLTPVVTPVVETTAVSQTVEMPTVPPVVVTPATPVVKIPPVISVPVAAPPVEVTPAVIPLAETSVVSPVVETPVVSTFTAVVTPVVETPALVSVTITEAAPPVSTSAVPAMVETSVVNPVVEKLTAASVAETSAVTSVVEVAAVGLIVETPTVTPVVETEAVVSVTEATPPVLTPAVTPVAETSVVSPVLETLGVKPTAASAFETSIVTLVVATPAASVIVETPAVTPVVETKAVLSVTEATPQDITPSVTPIAETSIMSPVLETTAVKPTAVAESAAVSPGLKTPVEEAPQVTSAIETPAITHVEVTQPVASVVTTIAAVSPVVVTPVIKETKSQVAEQEKKEPKTESPVVAKDVKPLVPEKEVKISVKTSEEGISNKDLPKELSAITTEPQPEVEEDVWEDAVDDIGDAQCPMTQASVVPQDTAAKQASDASVSIGL